MKGHIEYNIVPNILQEVQPLSRQIKITYPQKVHLILPFNLSTCKVNPSHHFIERLVDHIGGLHDTIS